MQPIFTTYEKAITKITKRREKGRKKLVLWISFTFYFYTVDWGGNFSKVSKKFSVGEKSDLQNQHILIQNSWLSKIHQLKKINVAGFLKNDWFQNVHKG